MKYVYLVFCIADAYEGEDYFEAAFSSLKKAEDHIKELKVAFRERALSNWNSNYLIQKEEVK